MPFPQNVNTSLIDGQPAHAIDLLGVQRISVGPTMYNILSDQYGSADPTGAADSLSAITSALSAASAVGGGVVYMPAPASGTTYAISDRIVVPFNVELRAAGRNTTTVKALGSFPNTGRELIRLGDLSGNIGVGCRVMDLRLDCNNIAGTTGVYSERINENSGIYRCSISNYASRGIQIAQPGSGGTPQHFTIDDVEIYSGSGTGASAIGLDVAMTSLGTVFREIRSITVFATGFTQLTKAIKIDGANGALQGIHVENAVDGVLIGSVLGCFGLSVRDVDGMTNVTNLVHLSNAHGSRSIVFMDLSPNGATNSLVDDRFSNTITTDIGLYVVGSNWCLASDQNVINQLGRTKIQKDLQRSRQTPSETTLVSGVDATAGELVAVTLTAARLVGAPTNPSTGQRLTFTLVQDGTGGRAVTWNAAFKVSWSDTGNTANKRSTISFNYDGTNWNQDGAQTPYV